MITESPSSQPGVLGPTFSTIPAPSWPPMNGNVGTGMSPVATWSSE